MEPINYSPTDFGSFLKEIKKFNNPKTTLTNEQITKFLKNNKGWLQHGMNHPHLGMGELLKSLKGRIEKSNDPSLAPALKTVSNKLKQIRDVRALHSDLLAEVLEKNTAVEGRRAARVSKTYQIASQKTGIKVIKNINERKIPLKTMFQNADEAVKYLVGSLNKEQIEYLDFDGLPLNDVQFEKIVKNCPNLTFLNIKGSTISGDALKNLQFVPHLTLLNIEACQTLGEDGLKNLKFVPGLHSLNISNTGFDVEALRNLQHVPNLANLIMQRTDYNLQHLHFVPLLLSLDLAGCHVLESDALSHLQFVPHLQSLNIARCNNLEKDALKNLKFVPKLTSLSMVGITHFHEDALKYLRFVLALTSLNLGRCQLEEHALRRLELVPELKWLGVVGFYQDRSDLPNRPGLVVDGAKYLK